MATVAPVSADLYEVLGAAPSATGDEIARAFRTRAKQLHPDTSVEPDAAARFSELVAAYGVLSNHRTRRDYDHARARQRTERVPGSASPATAATPKWTRRRAWTAVVAGALVALLGVGAAILTWQLHQHDAERRARYVPVTAVRDGSGGITFTTADNRVVRTREPEQHGEGSSLGPTVRVRYDPANPTHTIVDASTIGRDITFAIVSLKLIVGGVVFVVIGALSLRKRERVSTAAR